MDLSRRDLLRAAAAMLVDQWAASRSWTEPSHRLPDRKVVLVMCGGIRREETFAGTGYLNIPHIQQELLSQAQKLRNDIQKRAERALKDLEDRTQKLISAIEKQAEKGVEPILRSLNLASRDEVEKLKKRLNHIEKRLEEIAASKAA